VNIKILASMALVACVSQVAFADQSGNVNYSGNAIAKRVCKAVVQDDVDKLRVLLRSYKQSVAFGYRFGPSARGLSRDFTCNDMDLEQFSYRIGAQKVSGYFAGEAEAAQSQLASTGE